MIPRTSAPGDDPHDGPADLKTERGSNEGDLAATRADLDALDTELVALLARRATLVRRAFAQKRAAGLPNLDPAREATIVARARALAAARGLDAAAVEDVFRAVLRLSRTLRP